MSDIGKNFLAKLDVIVDTSHLQKVNSWLARYDSDSADNFERQVMVSRYTGRSSVVKDSTTSRLRRKYSYNPHIQACRKWASLFFNERTEMRYEGQEEEGEDAGNKANAELEFLNAHYIKAGVWPMLETEFPEIFGVGTMAVSVEYSPEYGIMYKWHPANAILPIESAQGRIRSVVFVSSFTEKGKKYTLYNIHEEIRVKDVRALGEQGVSVVPGEKSSYKIRNVVTKGGSDTALDAGQFGIESEYTSPNRLFAIFKPFNRSLRDFNNSFGIPIYHDSMDMIREIDELYDIKQIDTETSRRNIFIDKDALVYDGHGRANIAQHLHASIVSLQGIERAGGGTTSDIITEFAPTPHMDLYTNELQSALNRFSDAVGLGSDAFKAEKGSIATATQIVSDNQEKYVNLKKHLSILSSEFIAFNRAILTVASQSGIAEELNPELPIGYFIQDSVIIDDETRRQQAVTEVGAGLMSTEYYVENYRGLSGNELKIELKQLKSSSVDDMFKGVSRFMSDNSVPDKEADDTGEGEA